MLTFGSSGTGARPEEGHPALTLMTHGAPRGQGHHCAEVQGQRF